MWWDHVSYSSVTYYLFSFRFASFVEGKSHLEDNEVLDYETGTPREIQFSEEDDSDSESDSVLTDWLLCKLIRMVCDCIFWMTLFSLWILTSWCDLHSICTYSCGPENELRLRCGCILISDTVQRYLCIKCWRLYKSDFLFCSYGKLCSIARNLVKLKCVCLVFSNLSLSKV